MSKEFAYLVYAGRFQPFHNGHLDILRTALAKAETAIVVLGSARRARNTKNPFSDSEREGMIKASVTDLDPKDAVRLAFCPVRDYYDNDRWVAKVKEAVSGVAGAGARIGIIGHHKDNTSYYLHEFPEWTLVHEDNFAGLCATDIRREFFAENPDWDKLAVVVPPAVLAFLKEFRISHHFSDLARDHAALQKGKALWASAPYPPVFTTTDAVVRCMDHILMVRRGGHPGHGQWALPGGFLEQDERLRDCAIRELSEETGIAVSPDALRKAIAGKHVFDHPARSERGRTVTHAFFFDLDQDALPELAAADDATEARWVHVRSIRDMEPVIFEDHVHILDQFIRFDWL